MTGPPTTGWRRQWRIVATGCLLAGVGWAYWPAGQTVGGLITRTPPGYYGLLTDALLSGQLNLKIQPSRALLNQANPYDNPQGELGPHDMSFYRGKFYLYFGVTPVVILMLPWRILTGTFLTETAATFLFCYGGFLIGTWWLLALRRRLFSEAPIGWTWLAIAVFGFASPAFILSGNTTFYAVPIGAAFYCLMAALWLVDHSVRAEHPAAACGWLAGASLMHGLAVGARPVYVLGTGWLLLPAVWLWWRQAPNRRFTWIGARIWLSAIIPVAVIGGLLALYNYLRFGNPAEFGMQYGLNTMHLRGAHLMGLGYIGQHLRLYLLQTANFTAYFPFLFTGDQPFGVLPHLTLATLAAAFPFTLLGRALRRDAGWAVGGGFLLGTALTNLVVLSMFFWGEARYQMDFTPPALLLGAVMPALAAGRLPRPSWWRRVGAATLAAAGVWTICSGAGLAWSLRPPTALGRKVEYLANTVVDLLGRLHDVTYGPIEMALMLPQHATGRREPLLSTGGLAGTGDIVYVVYPDAQHVRIGVFHLGIGGPLSEPIPVDYATRHIVRIELGSLYPPRQHPFFRRWTDSAVDRLRRRCVVTWDGQAVVNAAVDVYPANPDQVYLGGNQLAQDVCQPRFTGQILNARRLPARPPPHGVGRGPVSLRLRFPATRGGAPWPLVSTGRTGAGDLLFVQILPDGRLQFGHDCWGYPVLLSDPIATDLTKIHTVDVEMGSLYGPDDKGVAPTLRHQLAIWLDGRLVFDGYRPFNPSTPDNVEFGYNLIRASSAVGMFSGTIFSVERLAPRPRPAGAGGWGPVEMVVTFPKLSEGRSEPLLVSGIPGTSDIAFVRYLDDRHVIFGFDHWGAGGPLSPPVAMDYAKPHRIEIFLGCLYPPDGDAAWSGHHPPGGDFRRHVEIRCDGQVVLSANRPLYSSRPDEVEIGRNDVAASSCDARFNGSIISLERLPW